MRASTGHEVKTLNEQDNEKQVQFFQGYVEPVMRFQPGDWFLTRPFALMADKYFNFELRNDDVFIMTFPKTGTTWTQEIVWNMRNNPNLDKPEASLNGNFRIPFLEFDAISSSTCLPAFSELPDFNDRLKRQLPGIELNETNIFWSLAQYAKSPRTIKTHLPFSLAPRDLSKSAKVIYVMRNIKDVCLSYFHHHRLQKFHDFTGTLEEFVQFFIDDEVMYAPIWGHMKEAWAMKNDNIHFCLYEQLQTNPVEEFNKLNSFLGTGLTSNQINDLVDYTSFENMQKRAGISQSKNGVIYVNETTLDSDGGFFRKGKVNDWQNVFSTKITDKLDKWEQKMLADCAEDFRNFYNRTKV